MESFGRSGAHELWNNTEGLVSSYGAMWIAPGIVIATVSGLPLSGRAVLAEAVPILCLWFFSLLLRGGSVCHLHAVEQG